MNTPAPNVLTNLCTLRAEEKWDEIWQTLLKIAKQNSQVESSIVAEGAFALAQIGQLEQARMLAERVLQTQANLLALRTMVVVYLKQKDYHKALAMVQSAFSSPFEFKTPEEAALILLALASVYHALNDLDKVREVVSKSLCTFPLANAYFLLGATEFAAGNFEQGRDNILSGLALAPHDINMWFCLANNCNKFNRIEEMLQTYEGAMQHHPEKPELLSSLGECYTRLFRYVEAETLLRKVTDTNPEHVAGWVNLGKLLYILEREDCVEPFKIALQISPESTELLFNTGQILLLKSPNDSFGIQLIKRAYDLTPENIQIATTYALICEDEGNANTADEVLHALALKNPDSSIIMKTFSTLTYSRKQVESGLAFAQDAIDKELYFLQQQSRLSLFGDGAHPPMDVYDASETLIAVCQFLERLQVPYFLSVGTLLGIIRDGELLPHDKDTDLGIGWDVDREWLLTQFEDSEEFAINGPRPEPGKAVWNFSVIRKGTPIGVDFFFHKPDGDDWLMGFYATPTPWLIRFKQRKLTTVEYKGHLLPIPENPEGYLEEVYGPDWRIPMPSYDTVIAASNLCPETYLATKIIGYDRLYEALKNRTWKKVLWYCEALKRFDNPPILDELAGWLRDAMPQKSDKVL